MEGGAVRVPGASFWPLFSADSFFLRRLAFRIVVYLDDFCLTNSEGMARSKTLTTAWFLSKLCYVINWKKPSVRPTQREEFLGFVIDTIQLMIFLPPEKVLKITALCLHLLERRCCSLRTLASLIWKLQYASTAILPAPLHCRFMQMSSIKGLARNHQSYVASVDLTGPVLEELIWWVWNLRSWNGKSFINPDPQLDVVITTDASLSGWGAECQGTTTQGQWSEEDRTQHINVLELKAAELALKSFTHLWQGSRVQFRLDKTTAASQILKMGSPKSLRCLVVTQEIWEHVLLHKSTAIVQHLPGKENVIADQQSRVFRDSSIWRLDSEEPLSSHSGGSFRRSSEPSVGLILELASRSSCRGGGCADHGVEFHESACISSVQTGSSNSEESPGREVRVVAGSSSMGPATVVSSPVTDVNRSTGSDTNVSRSVKSSRRVSPSFVHEQSSGAGGMASVRKSCRSSGFSAKAGALVGKARCAGTVRAYRSGWNFHMEVP